MDKPLEITFHNVDRPEEAMALLEEYVRRRVARLERRYVRVASCRVDIDSGGDEAWGESLDVTIEVSLPGATVEIHDAGRGGAHMDPIGAIRDAFHVAERALGRRVELLP